MSNTCITFLPFFAKVFREKCKSCMEYFILFFYIYNILYKIYVCERLGVTGVTVLNINNLHVLHSVLQSVTRCYITVNQTLSNIMNTLTFNQIAVFVQKENGHRYFDATLVAKQYSKTPRYWLRLKETKAYVEAYLRLNCDFNAQLIITTEGNNGTTWLHEDLLVAFARWISPDFAVWCDIQIKTLLLEGTVSMEDVVARERFILLRDEYNRIVSQVDSEIAHLDIDRSRYRDIRNRKIKQRMQASSVLPSDFDPSSNSYYVPPITLH